MPAEHHWQHECSTGTWIDNTLNEIMCVTKTKSNILGVWDWFRKYDHNFHKRKERSN